ncbi:preprotein translocase subunit YajC [Carbonactinospora thermoautotrophica]|nr:preprotein translocase subunit YajC [Carbonactinospora thermoautotrophica]
MIWLLFFAAMIFLLFVLPARQRRRHMEQIESALRPGVEVMTTGGLFAKVSSVEGDAVVLEVAPGVTNRYAKQAIARVITGGAPAGLDGADPAGDGTEDTDTKDKPSE